MFKSVFLKYITAFLLIILGSFLIMSSVITALVNDYSTNVKINVLTNVTSFFSYHVKIGVAEKSKAVSFEKYVMLNEEELEDFIKTININTYSFSVIIADKNGKILLSGGNNEDDEPFSDYHTGKSSLVDPELFQVAQAEENNKLISDFNGNLKSKHIFCTSKITPLGVDTVGYIIACTSNTGMNSLLHTLLQTIIMSTLWIMLAFLVVVYFITERLVSPLREMSRAAKEYASGKFDARVSVKGNDEIADLGNAFNNMASSLSSHEETRRLFLANISHDLRTPMTTISGFIDGMLDGAIPEEQRDYYLSIVASETRRLSRLVSSLLDITQIQAGERKFINTDFDVCETCREIIISSEQRINDKELSVSLDCESDNIFVNADKDAVHQIIYNLVDNAIKYSNRGTEFIISVKEEENKIYISVFNYGEGITDEDLPHIFERFYKADKSRGLDKSGSGLGLYISKTICDALGEKIYAESKFGSWCRITFTLEIGENPRKKTADSRN